MYGFCRVSFHFPGRLKAYAASLVVLRKYSIRFVNELTSMA